MTRPPQELPSDDEHLWCVVCERTFRIGQYRQVGEQRLCPYAGCEGGLLFEPRPWAEVRQANAGYPAEPSEHVCYPWFGGASRSADDWLNRWAGG